MLKYKISLASLFLLLSVYACSTEDVEDTPKSFNASYTSIALLDSNINDPSAVDSGPEVSANGLELYFHSSRTTSLGGMDLYISTRATATGNWGLATNVGATLNTTADERAPSLSADGLTLVFASNRAGSGGMDLYISTRASLGGSWSAPANLGAVVNSSYNESGPDITVDGLVLFFVSDDPNGVGADDIYATTRVSLTAPWSLPVNLGSIVNSTYFDVSPEMAADGLSLYFHSTRPGGPGAFNIWRASRATRTAAWGAPVLMPAPVNSAASAFGPGLSNDWKTLYYSTDDNGGNHDIWQAVP